MKVIELLPEISENEGLQDEPAFIELLSYSVKMQAEALSDLNEFYEILGRLLTLENISQDAYLMFRSAAYTLSDSAS